MSEAKPLYLSQDTFEHLHELSETKKGRVTLAKQDLVHLLMDYSIMRELLGSRVKDPAKRERLHVDATVDGNV